MVSPLALPTRLVAMFVLGAPLFAQSIPDWSAPPFWSPPQRARAHATSAHEVQLTSVESLQAATTSPLPFVGVEPCRLADTRGNGFTGLYGPPSLGAGSPRDFPLWGKCGVPGSAQAVSLNVTVTNTQGPGFIVIFPHGVAQPGVSTLNYVAHETIANAAVAALGADGAITVVAGVSGTDLIIDVNGYYAGGVGDFNTFLGGGAGNFTMTGSHNVGIGNYALVSNTTGTGNASVGVGALGENSTGDSNTAIGTSALTSNTMGSVNTAIGSGTLQRNTTGYSNIALGAGSGFYRTTGNYNIDIGNPGGGDAESGAIRIGVEGIQTATFVAGIRNAIVSGASVLVDPISGQLGVALSSARFKDEIHNMGDVSQDLMKLRPVTFRYKPAIDPKGIAQYGLVAEEVAKVYPDLVIRDENGQAETIRYQALTPMLLNELQKQQRTIEQQREQIRDLTSWLLRLEETIGASKTVLQSRLP